MNLKKKVKISLVIFALFSTASIVHASFLEDEAGISAFCKLNSVNFVQAACAYKNIEYQTDDYIIGSVAIENYPESDDVHVYLHATGDMIAYYFKQEQVAKIIDWKSYYATGVFAGSKLETALKNVANAMGQNPSNVQYYDFRFPAANSLKIVLEEARNQTETFRMLIPSSYLVYNRSFSHAIVGTSSISSGSGTLSLNSASLSTGAAGNGQWRIIEGELSPTQLSPDVYHTFSIQQNNYGWGHVAVVLLYTEP